MPGAGGDGGPGPVRWRRAGLRRHTPAARAGGGNQPRGRGVGWTRLASRRERPGPRWWSITPSRPRTASGRSPWRRAVAEYDPDVLYGETLSNPALRLMAFPRSTAWAGRLSVNGEEAQPATRTTSMPSRAGPAADTSSPQLLSMSRGRHRGHECRDAALIPGAVRGDEVHLSRAIARVVSTPRARRQSSRRSTRRRPSSSTTRRTRTSRATAA
jgi:hypothetical protein